MKAKKIEFVEVTDDVIKKAATLLDVNAHMTIFNDVKGNFRVAIRMRRESLEEVDFLFYHFGGYRAEQEIDGKIFYWINFQQRRAYVVMDLIQPYLVHQGEQAKNILLLKKMVDKNHRRRLSEEQKLERKEIIDKIKALNHARNKEKYSPELS